MALKAYSLARDGALHLTPHFRVREFACRDGSDPIFVEEELAALVADNMERISARQRVPHRRPQRFDPRRFAPQPASVRAGR